MSDHVENLSARAEAMAEALAGAYLRAAEVAVKKIDAASAAAGLRQELALQVAEARMRLAAVDAVMSTVAALKAPLLERLVTATSAAEKALLERHLEVYTAKEIGLLEAAGVPAETARQAVLTVDSRPVPGPGEELVVARQRRKANGTFERRNGVHADS